MYVRKVFSRLVVISISRINDNFDFTPDRQNASIQIVWTSMANTGSSTAGFPGRYTHV